MIKYIPNPREIKAAFEELILFIKKPVENVRNLPDWQWPTLISVCVILSAAIGSLSGIVNLKVTSVIYGAIIYPISTLLMMAVFTGLFYYTFFFFFNKKVEVRKLATNCFFCALPWIALAPFVDYLPPLSPLGIILTGLLAIVAFTENFQLNRKSVSRMILSIVAVFLIFWVINIIRVASFSNADNELITPESIDILEQELDAN